MKQVFFWIAKMADASQSLRVAKKIPDNLYELCLTNLVNYLQKSKCHRDDLHSLPDTILMDVYYKVRLLHFSWYLVIKTPVCGRDTVIFLHVCCYLWVLIKYIICESANVWLAAVVFTFCMLVAWPWCCHAVGWSLPLSLLWTRLTCWSPDELFVTTLAGVGSKHFNLIVSNQNILVGTRIMQHL